MMDGAQRLLQASAACSITSQSSSSLRCRQLQEVGRPSLPYERVCHQLQQGLAAALGYRQLQEVAAGDLQQLLLQHKAVP
jgi:hypothetical protein